MKGTTFFAYSFRLEICYLLLQLDSIAHATLQTEASIPRSSLPTTSLLYSSSSSSSSSLSTSNSSGTGASSPPSSSSSTALRTPAAAAAPEPAPKPPGVTGAKPDMADAKSLRSLPPPSCWPGVGAETVVFLRALSSRRDFSSLGVVSSRRMTPPVG